MSYKTDFIHFMVRSGVLTFGDFVTKSGRKTPYFINTGNYKTGEQMYKLSEFYADCIAENMKNGALGEFEVLFGPAYKGITLASGASAMLYGRHDINKCYCYNRKEVKDHGEGGVLVGYKPQNGDRVVIVEDVVTAGTAVRETLPVLKAAADVDVIAIVISVDRMEKGAGDITAIEELYRDFGIKAFPIVTIKEVVDELYNKPIDGKVLIDDEIMQRIRAYWDAYCVGIN